jgi:hypothetical protein
MKAVFFLSNYAGLRVKDSSPATLGTLGIG